MTLSFSTKWPERMGELAGEPNYFIEKIWAGLPEELQMEYLPEYFDWHFYLLKYHWHNKYGVEENTPKLHTIRRDEHNRWKPGMDIHFVINNRTKERFQFAPVVKCVSVQTIEIRWQDDRTYMPLVHVGSHYLGPESIESIAINDGFPSVEALFSYFNTDFKGKIIHFTDLKY